MSGVGSAATYRNPFWQGCFPDPFVLKVRGRYYAYGTEQRDRPRAPNTSSRAGRQAHRAQDTR